MFGSKKENEVTSLMTEHLDKVADAVEKAVKCISSYIAGDMKNAKEYGFRTHLLEEEADTKRRAIIEKLHKGAFMPILREDLIRLVAHQDRIADKAESCCDFALMQIPEIPDEFKKQFSELLKASVDTIKPYIEAAKNMFIDYKIVLECIKEVNHLEEEADTIEWHLTKDVFKSNIPLALKILLRDFIIHIVCISDVIENAADDLDIVIVKQTL